MEWNPQGFFLELSVDLNGIVFGLPKDKNIHFDLSVAETHN